MCGHLPVGPFITLCSSGFLAFVHYPGTLSHPGESIRNSGRGVAAGGQPEGGPLFPDKWLQGVQLFSTQLCRRIPVCLCLSENQCPFVCVHFGRPLCVCTEPHARNRQAGATRLDHVSLRFQRHPDGQCVGLAKPRTQVPYHRCSVLCFQRAMALNSSNWCLSRAGVDLGWYS